MCCVLAKLGEPFGIVLDYINVYWLPDPIFIMGGMSMVAAFMTVFFPESYEETLPRNLDEAINIGANHDNYPAKQEQSNRRHFN